MREIKKEVVYDFIEKYLNSFTPKMSEELTALQQEAIKDNIPIIKPEVINFMKTMLTLKRPVNILEVGTAYAFSAILMCETLPECNITTIERDGYMLLHAHENIKKFNLEDRINVLEGDGVEMLKSLDENEKKYDFIFIDASKSHYNEFMKECKRLIQDKGVIVCDNVLYKGLVAKDRFEVIRRNRTIHKRMNDFVNDAYSDEAYDTCLIPAGDGILISSKK
ncbi:MAG: O-methyltransferase [Clostridia bacterium]|nr:O-methyltransferase [Clostridia bacterium]